MWNGGSSTTAFKNDQEYLVLVTDQGSSGFEKELYPPPKIRIGVPVYRDLPRGCGRLVNHNASSSNSRRILSNKNSSLERKKRESWEAEGLKVKKVLNLFQDLYQHLSEEHKKAKYSRGKSEKGCNRIDLEAAKILKREGKWVNRDVKSLGNVPGVEIGDQFQYRIQLLMIGLHMQSMGGIDFMRKDGKILATSIVATGNNYANGMESPDFLIYSGQGGNPRFSTHGKSEDQKLERGNLALKNSRDLETPVRVIRKLDSMKMDIYVYDGLYTVTKCTQERGEEYGKLVFMFELKRLPGQPKLN